MNVWSKTKKWRGKNMPAYIVTSGTPWAMRLAIRFMRKQKGTTSANENGRIYVPVNAGLDNRTDGRTYRGEVCPGGSSFIVI